MTPVAVEVDGPCDRIVRRPRGRGPGEQRHKHRRTGVGVRSDLRRVVPARVRNGSVSPRTFAPKQIAAMDGAVSIPVA